MSLIVFGSRLRCAVSFGLPAIVMHHPSPTQDGIRGAKWWRVDFHTHTPASEDYRDRSVTHEQWLLAHMAQGLDAVVVTDHQSGGWIDLLKQTYAAMESLKPAGFRPLTIFPGVEIAVSDGTHVLFIFDPTGTSSDILRLLGLAKYQGKEGDPAGRADASLLDLLKDFRNPQQRECLAIPAHVNGANGLFFERAAIPADSSGGPVIAVKHDQAMRKKLLEHEELFAVEVLPRSDVSKINAELSVVDSKHFARVFGSDSHELAAVARRSTWVKMQAPSLVGLRLALLDGEDAVREYEATDVPPEAKRAKMLTRIRVENGKILGRKAQGIPDFDLSLSPCLNTIIGGRSAGKSSVIELTRQACNRAHELAESDGTVSSLRANFDELLSFLDTGDPQHPVRAWLEYTLHGQLFGLDWRRVSGIDQWKTWEWRSESGEWQAVSNDVQAERFPVRIFSQKQIYSFAKRPDELLAQVDAHPDVAVAALRDELEILRKKYFQLSAEQETLRVSLAEKPKYDAMGTDLARQIALIQQSGHTAVLEEKQLRMEQHADLEKWSRRLADCSAPLGEVAKALEIPSFAFSRPPIGSEEGELLAATEETRVRLHELAKRIREIAADLTTVRSQWQSSLNASRWHQRVIESDSAYTKLVTSLQSSGVQDPQQFGKLLAAQTANNARLEEMNRLEQRRTAVEGEINQVLTQYWENRREISRRRETFIQATFGPRQEFKVALLRYQARKSAITKLREILKRHGDVAQSDIQTITDYLYPAGAISAQDFEARLSHLKTALRQTAQLGVSLHEPKFTGWFINHLKTLNLQDWCELDLWVPDDGLDLQYKGGDEKLHRVQDSSPGQAAAAILAFLLAFGDEPILLDQPEDDLDNRLIYDLIVKQLRENKCRRQIVIVTHSANIVVNGNSEVVFALEPRSGQTRVCAEGSLQMPQVRDSICKILEGGEQALKRRFRRILERNSTMIVP